MCSIQIDEPTIHVSITTWPSHLCVRFSKKLDSLFDRLDNRRMMHAFFNIMRASGRTGIEITHITVATCHFTSIYICFILC
jgi:hypothetical protein